MIGRILILLTRRNLLLLLTHLIILTKEKLNAFYSKKQFQTRKAKNTPKSMLYLVHITYMRSVCLGRVIQICNLFSSWFTKTRVIYILNMPYGIPFRHSAAIITAIVLSCIWIYRSQIQTHFAAKFKLAVVYDSREANREVLPHNSDGLF